MTAKIPNCRPNGADQHIPVLLSAVLQYLAPTSDESYLDNTAGYGGHAGAVLERTLQPKRATLVDRDQSAINSLIRLFTGRGVEIIHSDFLSACQKLADQKRQYDMILADLGTSSPQLDIARRGFSFGRDGPLDMRMDNSIGLTASEVVNNYKLAELVEVIRRYGEEPNAQRIAEAIVAARPINSTKQLATIVAQTTRKKGKIHPATKTFQAVRIEVNKELEQLAQSLPIWLDLLAPGGRLAVISFHSLEDRLVKQFFKDHSQGYEAKLKILTKLPVAGNQTEIVSNPRARSAKLRVAVKQK